MSPIRSSRLWTRCWDKQRQIILRIKIFERIKNYPKFVSTPKLSMRADVAPKKADENM
ncbi:uncharacterized protein PHALS_04607 [Plasmopara halstedii]|uniref:Uncharacterized protein n=1 Tax=Plasmopara halstedii TaxID=4781 RepID=A0A0P1A8V5_PLAHL|nr:uncharacterized protein PHALS_04607 [Plasmopara halstedii]CEG37158.1 hypothetical protein PHALS_04607 [Plasmopara halstedii]|eukprot:XP_024573527.1 hypothetical protein PHALS_04607 [Plasmopara halstedii]